MASDNCGFCGKPIVLTEQAKECKCGATNRELPTLTCSEVVERLGLCIRAGKHCFSTGGTSFCEAQFDHAAAEKILTEWRERRVQELEQQAADHKLFLSQLTAALGLADDGRVWFGTGLLARAETLVKREAEWREQIRKGAKHE